MKLITENMHDIKTNIVESASGKEFFIEGIFMQAEAKNRNGRVYPKEVLKKATDTFIKEKVETGRALGELDHPAGPQINLDKVSHRIVELHWEGNDIMGKAAILNTPTGIIVKGLLEGGCQLGVSSRGLGAVKESVNGAVIQPGFVLRTVDIVQDPSAPSAFVNGIMEGVDYFYNGHDFIAEKAEEERKRMEKMSVKQIDESAAQSFQNFLAAIRNQY